MRPGTSKRDPEGISEVRGDGVNPTGALDCVSGAMPQALWKIKCNDRGRSHEVLKGKGPVGLSHPHLLRLSFFPLEALVEEGELL